MRFLSIYKSVETGQPPSAEHIAAMGKLIEESMRRGELIATEGCLPSKHGARVRIENGRYSVVDGPFTESKEVVGGFAILEAPSKEKAIEYTKNFLNVVGGGECEVRQLYQSP